jgi:acetyl/propionyl-CoA carboxylase alpha subunit
VNTRLQVEHPVTELVTGVDLVLEQFRVASGRPLRMQQGDIEMNGHAIECRIAAEDPFNNFAPSLGDIVMLGEPSGPGVRVDSGLYRGGRVPIYYDPMVAKLIVWGPSRAHAILRMQRALEEYRIVGISTNIPFHLGVMHSIDFQRGRLDTRFVERYLEGSRLSAAPPEEFEEVTAIVAALVAHRTREGSSAAPSLEGNGRVGSDGSYWRRAGRERGLR